MQLLRTFSNRTDVYSVATTTSIIVPVEIDFLEQWLKWLLDPKLSSFSAFWLFTVKLRFGTMRPLQETPTNRTGQCQFSHIRVVNFSCSAQKSKLIEMWYFAWLTISGCKPDDRNISNVWAPGSWSDPSTSSNRNSSQYHRRSCSESVNISIWLIYYTPTRIL